MDKSCMAKSVHKVELNWLMLWWFSFTQRSKVQLLLDSNRHKHVQVVARLVLYVFTGTSLLTSSPLWLNQLNYQLDVNMLFMYHSKLDWYKSQSQEKSSGYGEITFLMFYEHSQSLTFLDGSEVLTWLGQSHSMDSLELLISSKEFISHQYWLL